MLCCVVSATVIVDVRTTGARPSLNSTDAVMVCVPTLSRLDSNGYAGESAHVVHPLLFGAVRAKSQLIWSSTENGAFFRCGSSTKNLTCLIVGTAAAGPTKAYIGAPLRSVWPSSGRTLTFRAASSLSNSSTTFGAAVTVNMTVTEAEVS